MQLTARFRDRHHQHRPKSSPQVNYPSARRQLAPTTREDKTAKPLNRGTKRATNNLNLRETSLRRQRDNHRGVHPHDGDLLRPGSRAATRRQDAEDTSNNHTLRAREDATQRSTVTAAQSPRTVPHQPQTQEAHQQAGACITSASNS